MKSVQIGLFEHPPTFEDVVGLFGLASFNAFSDVLLVECGMRRSVGQALGETANRIEKTENGFL